MNGHIGALALNTFRETVRDRIFYLVGIFGLVLLASTAVLSPLTVGAQAKIMSDVGLAAMVVIGYPMHEPNSPAHRTDIAEYLE